MRRVLIAFLLVLACSLPTFGQGNDNTYRPTVTPPTPTCPFHRVFLNVSGQLAKVDCTGVVTVIGSGGPGTSPAGPSGAVQYNNAGAFGGDAKFSIDVPGATLTLGGSTVPGALKLSGINNNVVVIGVQNPAANRTYYWPDNTPTAGQALVAQSVGATVTLGFANVIQGTVAANQVPVGSGPNTVAGNGNFTWNAGTLATTSTLNSDTGYLSQNTNAGTAAQAVVAVSSNAIGALFGATSGSFTTAGKRIANQVYLFGSSSTVEMLYELGDASARFAWAAGGAERGRWDNTGLGIGVTPSTRLDVDSGVANDSGVRMRRLTSASPTSAGQPIGVDVNGKIVTVAAGGGGGGAPTTAQYLTLAADATLTAERILTAGVGITGTDGGANNPYTIAIDPAAPITWTTVETFKPGTTSTVAIRLGMDAPGSVGQMRDGHYIEFQGASNDGSTHTATFRMLTDIVSPDGQGSELAIRHRLDAGSVTNVARFVSDGSLIAAGALYSGSSAVQITSSAGNLRPQAFASADLSGNSNKLATFVSPVTGGRCAEWDAFGNLVQAAVACGGSPVLTATQVGFGSGGNTLTGSANFTYQDANGLLTLSRNQNAITQISSINANTGVNGAGAVVAQSNVNAFGLIATGSANTAYGANLALLRAETGFSSLTIQTASAFPVIVAPNATEMARVDTTNGTSLTAPGGAGNSGLRLINLPNAPCLSTNASGIVVSVSCGGVASAAWSSLTNPTGNLALTMAANTSTFTYNNATGSANLFRLTDTASNTGTGKMVRFDTATASTLRPFSVEPRGLQALLVDHLGNVVTGLTSRTITDTDGWLYLPSINGQNINAPTGHAGFVPIYVDTTSNTIRAFYSSNWNSLGGGSGTPLATLVNSNYTATTADSLISMDATAGNRSVSAYVATGNTGKVLEACKRDTSVNVVTFNATSAYPLSTPGACVRVVSDGSNWILQ